MSQIRVAGLDPSFSNLGMVKGVVDMSAAPFAFHLQQMQLQVTQSKKKGDKTPKNMDDVRRARELYTALSAFLSDVDVVMAEVPIGSQSARAMASYGVCVGLMGTIGVPLIRVSPKEVKHVSGNPEASKQDMIHWATFMYPNAPWLTKKRQGEVTYTNANEHLADAVGAVHAGLRSDAFATFLLNREPTHESIHQDSDYTDWLRRLPGSR